jgi:putative endonuclease
MNNDQTAYVYIMASASGTLYIGVTNDLERRVCEHKTGLNEGFTKKYQCHKLVYSQEIGDISEAIALEKKIKGCSRWKKECLIRSQNPTWADLARTW